jgi:hypothetical protein
MEDRTSLGLHDQFNSLTDVNLEAFLTNPFSIRIRQAVSAGFITPLSSESVDQNHGRGASVTFNHHVLHKEPVTLDVGYSGLVYGYLNPWRPYLGFFNPSFYQRHYLTTHVMGKIYGPLGYDISADGGIQQVEHDSPIKPALLLSPAFTLRTSPRLSLTLGYTHYDSSEAVGTLSGNAVRLSTDWKF